jgi:hypothetical protein
MNKYDGQVPRFSWISNFSTNLGSKALATKVDFEAARETRKIERNINLKPFLIHQQ